MNFEIEKCLKLKDKICVVTGGADGIGLEIAKKFLQNGARLALLLDINDENGNKAVEEITSTFGRGKAVFIKCDVTKDLDKVFVEVTSKYQTIDVLVNSAGIADENDPNRMLDINLKAAIDMSLKFWRHMKGKNGTIINISSIFGLQITPLCPVYHATKFGVAAFSRSLGHNKRYEAQGVRVLTMCPGLTWTNMTAKFKNVAKNYSYEWQDVGAVGDAAVKMYLEATSGSVWVIQGGKLEEQNML